MPYHRTIRYESPLLAWHEVELTEPAPQWSAAYRPESPRLMVPGSRWVEAEQRGERFVCDALSPLWLTPAAPYRMRQPFAGQRSVVLIIGDAAGDAGDADDAGDETDALRAAPLQAPRPRLGPAAQWTLARCRAALDAGAPERLALEEAVLGLLLPSPAVLPVRTAAEGRAHRAVERARELLAAEPAADRSLHELAAAVACSPFHLARRFRRATGVGLHVYRTRLRMALALRRLADGEEALIQLALDLGYASHSHFSAASAPVMACRRAARASCSPRAPPPAGAAPAKCSGTRCARRRCARFRQRPERRLGKLRRRNVALPRSAWLFMIDSSKAMGLAMGLAAALIGGGWQVATRAATTGSALAPVVPADLVVLRYGIPALLLAPVLWRIGLVPALPARVSRWRLALLWIGAGLPFGLVAMAGSRHAPAAHMGVLMAGAAPLFATALAFVVWRERPGRAGLLGLALMTFAVLLLGGRSFAEGLLDSLGAWAQGPGAAAAGGAAVGGAAVGGAMGTAGVWRGDLLFLLAAALWSVYTVVFRRIGLGAWQAAAVVNAWSALAVLAWVLLRGGTQLAAVPLADLAWHALWQGLLGGVLGLWTFSVAIERLGAARAAAFGALAPVVSALGGWVWLGDALTPLEIFAVAAAVLGVALASGAFAAPPAAARHGPGGEQPATQGAPRPG